GGGPGGTVPEPAVVNDLRGTQRSSRVSASLEEPVSGGSSDRGRERKSFSDVRRSATGSRRSPLLAVAKSHTREQGARTQLCLMTTISGEKTIGHGPGRYRKKSVLRVQLMSRIL